MIESTNEQLIVPAPVLVEVDYWIYQRLHPGILVALLDDINAGAYQVEDLDRDDYRRARELCDQYADANIGFVDAGVLAITERLREPKLATPDRRHSASSGPATLQRCNSFLNWRDISSRLALPTFVVRRWWDLRPDH